MSKIQGTGGGFTPMTPVETQKAEDAESGQSVRDVQKQVATVVTKRVEISDGLETKRDAGLLGGLKDPVKQERAQAQLDAQYMPEARLIIEDAYKTRIDPQVALKLTETLKEDPKFMAAVENLRDIVEGFAQDALKAQEQLHAQNPITEPPKPSDANQAAQISEQNTAQNNQQDATLTAQTQSTQQATTQTEGAKADATKSETTQNDTQQADATADAAKADTTKADTTKADTTKADTTKADETKTDAATTDAKTTEQTDATKADTANADAVKDAEAQAPTEGSQAQAATPTEDKKAIEDANAANAAAEVEDADEIEEAPETKVQENEGTKEGVFPDYPQGEPGTLDESGMLIVSQENYDLADAEFKNAGITGPFMNGYTALMNQALQPVDTTHVGPAEGGGFADSAVDSPGGTTGGGASGGSSPSSSAGAAAPMFGASWAVLGGFENADVGELAYILLAETIREIGRDMRSAQQAMRMRHLVNDAMRKNFADFLDATVKLTKADVKDPRDIDKVEWTNQEPMPIFDEQGNCTGVEMVDVPIEQTFDKVHIDSVGGKSSTEVNLSSAEVADQYLPPAGKVEAAQQQPYGTQQDGTFIAKSSHIYVSAATVEPRREAFRTKLKAMKQDMEKEQLNVQKFMGMRKQVLENLTKLIKNRAEEQAKVIAQLRK